MNMSGYPFFKSYPTQKAQDNLKAVVIHNVK